MKRILPGISLLLICASGYVHGAEFTARIIAVLDGDTVLIRHGSAVKKIRLAGIDAPEKAQAFGEASRHSLSDLVSGKRARITSEATDQYGRMVARLEVDGLDINAEQVRRGMAWAAGGWRQRRGAASRPPEGAPAGVPLAGAHSNFHSNKTLLALQNAAQQEPRGLWAQYHPTPPWEWRRLHPSTQSGAMVASSRNRPVKTNVQCGGKKLCSEMSSCEEAKFYLTRCGIRTLDGDGDGQPCEDLCNPQQTVRD